MSEEYFGEPVKIESIDNEGFTKIAMHCLELATKIKPLESKLAALGRRIINLQAEKDRIEGETYRSVTLEIGEDGKNKYTNEKNREIQTQRLLQTLPEFKLVSDDLSSATLDLHETRADLESIKTTLKVYGMVIDIAKIQVKL